jgi:hypothetical protein
MVESEWHLADRVWQTAKQGRAIGHKRYAIRHLLFEVLPASAGYFPLLAEEPYLIVQDLLVERKFYNRRKHFYQK